MKIKNLIPIIIIAISFMTAQQNVIPDQVTKVATSAANWLKLDTDARAVGMGGAFVAAGEGIGAITYNPAAAAFITGSQLYYSKTNYLADITYNSIAYGTQLSATDFLGLHL
ncbi:MAG: hypothetical protein H8D46_02130, partial [FCB group bacterium]|nr:hypothetical protein [FCB group bacterium]